MNSGKRKICSDRPVAVVEWAFLNGAITCAITPSYVYRVVQFLISHLQLGYCYCVPGRIHIWSGQNEKKTKMAIFNLILYLHNNFVLFYSVLILFTNLWKAIKICLFAFALIRVHERNNDMTEWNRLQKIYMYNVFEFSWIYQNYPGNCGYENYKSTSGDWMTTDKCGRWQRFNQSVDTWTQNVYVYIHRGFTKHRCTCMHITCTAFVLKPDKWTFGDQSKAISCQLQIFHRLDIYLVHTVFCIDVYTCAHKWRSWIVACDQNIVCRLFWLQNAHHLICAAERKK